MESRDGTIEASAARAPDGVGNAAVLERPRPRLRVAIGAVVVVLLLGLAAAVVSSLLAPRGASIAIADRPFGAASDSPGGTGGATLDEAAAGEVVVHVLGAVVSPGLYSIPDGSRVVDAIAAAGGLAPEADANGVNLARVVTDAEQIVVPVLGDPAAGGGPPSDPRVNLNRADAETLESLPEIGPATARAIIAWREEHGGFRAVEDLLSVSGIGAKTLDVLRDLVTI